MFRYRLRSLLIVLALGPPAIAFTAPPLVRAIQEWLNPETEREKLTRLFKGVGFRWELPAYGDVITVPAKEP